MKHELIYGYCILLFITKLSAENTATQTRSIQDFDNSKLIIVPSNQDQETPMYKCQTTGQFEDVSSPNSYWLCDVSPEGGFVGIRRQCPEGQQFNFNGQKCILSAGKRDEDEHSPPPKISYVIVITEEAQTTTTECNPMAEGFPMAPAAPNKHPPKPPCPDVEPKVSTSCFSAESPVFLVSYSEREPRFNGKRDSILVRCNSEGVFSDPDSVTGFYLCHQKSDNPGTFERFKLHCPFGMRFNGVLDKCIPYF